MSNVVYKGKGQVPLYRIYRHSITPQGPREGQGDSAPLGAPFYSQELLSTAGGAARHLSRPDCSLFLLGPFVHPTPQLLKMSPMS